MFLYSLLQALLNFEARFRDFHELQRTPEIRSLLRKSQLWYHSRTVLNFMIYYGYPYFVRKLNEWRVIEDGWKRRVGSRIDKFSSSKLRKLKVDQSIVNTDYNLEPKFPATVSYTIRRGLTYYVNSVCILFAVGYLHRAIASVKKPAMSSIPKCPASDSHHLRCLISGNHAVSALLTCVVFAFNGGHFFDHIPDKVKTGKFWNKEKLFMCIFNTLHFTFAGSYMTNNILLTAFVLKLNRLSKLIVIGSFVGLLYNMFHLIRAKIKLGLCFWWEPTPRDERECFEKFLGQYPVNDGEQNSASRNSRHRSEHQSARPPRPNLYAARPILHQVPFAVESEVSLKPRVAAHSGGCYMSGSDPMSSPDVVGRTSILASSPEVIRTTKSFLTTPSPRVGKDLSDKDRNSSTSVASTRIPDSSLTLGEESTLSSFGESVMSLLPDRTQTLVEVEGSPNAKETVVQEIVYDVEVMEENVLDVTPSTARDTPEKHEERLSPPLPSSKNPIPNPQQHVPTQIGFQAVLLKDIEAVQSAESTEDDDTSRTLPSALTLSEKKDWIQRYHRADLAVALFENLMFLGFQFGLLSGTR